MLWVGLQFVIVVFPDHPHLLFGEQREMLHIVVRQSTKIVPPLPESYTNVRLAYLTASDTNYMIYLPCNQKSRFALSY